MVSWNVNMCIFTFSHIHDVRCAIDGVFSQIKLLFDKYSLHESTKVWVYCACISLKGPLKFQNSEPEISKIHDYYS